MTTGETELDVTAFRAWRFGAAYRSPGQVEAAGREVYKYYYRLRYPLDTDEWGRPNRLSPLHGRLQEAGAAFGVKNGWERADHFEPGRPWRRSGADQREFGWARPPWFRRVAEEHAAIRKRVGLIDMTSFGKIDVHGPGALPLLERVACNLVDRPLGSVVYTQLLNGRGGIVADVTVTRLGEDRFRVVTGAGVVDSDLGWLRANVDTEDGLVALRDASADLAVIGMWGPAARDVLAGATEDDVSPEAFPFRTARALLVAGAEVTAQRISYVGELGYELYLAPESAVQVWDALWRAGAEHGITPAGYRALDSLRIEKGYRYMGTDLTAADTPYEAGLGFCVALDKGHFIGRDALAAAGPVPARRIRTLLVGGRRYLNLYGGEAVHAGGEVVGRVRSCAYGHTVGRNVAYAYLPSELEPGASGVQVEVLGQLVRADVAEDVLYDPDHARVRA
jgi:4-methylaminobutanoate oxidase (formaldehyde-forming)